MGKGNHSGLGAETPQDSDLHPCCGSSGGHWSLHLHSGSLGVGFLELEGRWFITWPLWFGS